MKKLFVIVAVCGIAFGTTTSCKKERDCKCDDYSVKIPKGKKGDQETACEAMSIVYGNCKLS